MTRIFCKRRFYWQLCKKLKFAKHSEILFKKTFSFNSLICFSEGVEVGKSISKKNLAMTESLSDFDNWVGGSMH